MLPLHTVIGLPTVGQTPAEQSMLEGLGLGVFSLGFFSPVFKNGNTYSTSAAALNVLQQSCVLVSAKRTVMPSHSGGVC